MKTFLIKNGRLLDPSRSLDALRDLWVVDGRVAPDDFTIPKADEELDATGMLVMPGFVDVHVHLREPGNEPAETIETGCAAALAGGFTAISCMPNTTPTLDSPNVVGDVLRTAETVKGPRVYVLASVTAGRKGERPADLKALARCGVVGFTDDGAGVEDEAILRSALELCAEFGLPLAEHCEFQHLSAGGVMHPRAAERAGLPGYPAEAETAMIERDIRLSAETGAHVHFQHLSSARSVELIREARARGVKVTAEVTPHHLTLTDEDAAGGCTNFKMNPPLRSEADRQALREGLREGVIDMIVTDHAPHTPESKARPFIEAPFGVIGLETAAAVIWSRLVQEGILTPLEMADRMSAAPARAFGLPAGTLTPGSRGDVVLFDPDVRWTIEPERFRSKSRNCPFAGWEVRGRVAATIVEGEVRYSAALH